MAQEKEREVFVRHAGTSLYQVRTQIFKSAIGEVAPMRRHSPVRIGPETLPSGRPSTELQYHAFQESSSRATSHASKALVPRSVRTSFSPSSSPEDLDDELSES
jgi:hypothetical protein